MIVINNNNCYNYNNKNKIAIIIIKIRIRTEFVGQFNRFQSCEFESVSERIDFHDVQPDSRHIEELTNNNNNNNNNRLRLPFCVCGQPCA